MSGQQKQKSKNLLMEVVEMEENPRETNGADLNSKKSMICNRIEFRIDFCGLT
jgi:hypothetical protein